MANAVIGALRVVLGMDAAQFEKDTGKAQKAAKDFEKSVSGSFQTALGSMQTAMKAFAATFIAGLTAQGLAGIVTSFHEIARGVAEIGDQAKIAGVNVAAFQELKYVAEQNRIGVDALTDGLKEMNLRADEFILTGQGSGAEAFQRLGYNAETLKEKLKNPSDLFAEIIGRLEQLDKAAQIRIADELFGGTGGEQFVQLLDQGEQGVRDLITEANSLGIVMDEQLIERAAEIDRRFNQIATTVGTTLKSAIVSAADSLAEFIDGFRSYQNQMSSTLKAKQAELGQQRLDIENQILELQDKQRSNAESLSSTARSLGFEDSQNAAVAGYSGQIDSLKQQLKDLAGEEEKVVNVLSDRISPMVRSADREWTAPTRSGAPLPTKPSGGSKSGGGKSEADKQAESYGRVTQALRDELSMIGQSDTAQRILNAQRRAGVAATSAQGQEIANLVTQIDAQNRAFDQATEAGNFFADAMTDAFEGLIDGSKSLKDSLKDILSQLTRMWLNDAFRSLFGGTTSSGGGGGGGILGKLFGGLLGFANGGTILPGGTGGIDSQVVAFRKSPSEQVDIYDPRKSKSGGGGGGIAAVRVFVDDDGNWQAKVEGIADARGQRMVQAGLSAYDRRLPGRIGEVMERNG